MPPLFTTLVCCLVGAAAFAVLGLAAKGHIEIHELVAGAGIAGSIRLWLWSLKDPPTPPTCPGSESDGDAT